MPLDKVGFNINGINNISAPDFNLSTNATQFVDNIPIKANEYTGGWVGPAILIMLAFYLYIKLRDKTELAISRFSQIRSIGISCGITCIVGMVMFSIGYFTKLYPVIFFLVIFMLCFAWVVKEERSN